MSFSSVMESFILISSSCTIPSTLTCWSNPWNTCTWYIKCHHTFQLPFPVDSVISSVCVCMHVFAHVWTWLDLFEWSGAKEVKLHPNHFIVIIQQECIISLVCDLLKDLFLCWWSSFLLTLTLKEPFWFNIKINCYLGFFVCLTYSRTPHWRCVDSASVMRQDMARLKRARCSQQYLFFFAPAVMCLYMTVSYCSILLVVV